MAVREADGDSRSYFREGYEEQAKLPQTPFEAMPDWRLQKFIDRAEEWEGDKVPDGFDPWNSWGGEHTARQVVKMNAQNALKELESRKA
jgi:hypothetical protein